MAQCSCGYVGWQRQARYRRSSTYLDWGSVEDHIGTRCEQTITVATSEETEVLRSLLMFSSNASADFRRKMLLRLLLLLHSLSVPPLRLNRPSVGRTRRIEETTTDCISLSCCSSRRGVHARAPQEHDPPDW